jgi:sodium transport system permease protein
MGFTLHQQVSALGKDALEFELGTGVALKVFAAMIPCALLFSALLLAFAVFARSFREANAYLSPILMVLSFPAMVAMIPTVELSPATAFAPVVNLALLIREVLRGPVSAGMFFTVIAANTVYATMAVLLAARVFETEQVLLGGERPWRDLFGDARRAAVTPSPRQAVLFCALLIVAAWYGALYLLRAGVQGAVALALFQALIMLLPALLFVGASRLSFRETLLLHLPRGRAWLGTVLLASGAWGIGGVIQLVENHYFPGARAYYELMDRALADLGSSTALSLLAVAVLPAVAEEVCFRGVVLQGLGNTGSRAAALVGSALIFGLFHVNVYHAIGAGALGLVFGFAAMETGSLLPSVLAHMVNNGLGVLLLRWPSLADGMQKPWMFVVAVILAAVGLALLRGTRPQQAAASTPTSATG